MNCWRTILFADCTSLKTSKSSLIHTCKPNTRMCGWDCEPALRHLWMVRILFAANQNLSVFWANTKGSGSLGDLFALSRIYFGTRTEREHGMWTFNVDIFLRRGKQHSAVRWTFGEQPNAIRQMLVLQKKFTYDTFRCRRHFFYIQQWRQKNAANSFALTERTAWEQGVFAASANAEQCTNLTT